MKDWGGSSSTRRDKYPASPPFFLQAAYQDSVTKNQALNVSYAA